MDKGPTTLGQATSRQVFGSIYSTVITCNSSGLRGHASNSKRHVKVDRHITGNYISVTV